MTDAALSEDQAPRQRLRIGGKWILLIAIVIVSTAWVLRGRSGLVAAGAPLDRARVKSVIHLEPFVLNLVDPDQRAYLRVGIDLGVASETRNDGPPVALLRDTILGVLTRCTPDEVLAPEGKARVKGELLAQLRQRVPQLEVEDIYFTEFLVQR
jgi:flagellar basal body-associated protein FliL